jgi:hypothetical protein
MYIPPGEISNFNLSLSKAYRIFLHKNLSTLKRNDIFGSKFHRGMLVTILKFPATSRQPSFRTRPTVLEHKISSPLIKFSLVMDKVAAPNSTHDFFTAYHFKLYLNVSHPFLGLPIGRFRSCFRKMFLQRSLYVVVYYFLFARLFNDLFFILVFPFL